MIWTVVVCLSSYFIGNILGGKLLEKFYKEELATKGSGNIGARNAGRVLGARAFVFVLAVDFFKGFLVVILLKIFNIDMKIIYICILLVILGHIKPVLFKFKGGKGVATFLGAMAAVSINLFLVLILCTLVIAIVIKSLTIGFYGSLPILAYLTYAETHSYQVLVIYLLLVIVLCTVAIKDIEGSLNKYFISK